MKFTLFSAFLFSIGWMSVVVTGQERAVDCCLTATNTRIPVENIVKYEMQPTVLCPAKAVRFHTKKNIIICSDPDSKYAKRVIEVLDGMTAKPRPTCYTSTTNTIPTVTTTNKTPGTGTETSTSTTAPTTVTGIKTSGPETEITKTTTQATSVPKENPKSSLNTATTCGTEPTAPPTETTRKTPGHGTANTSRETTTTTRTMTKPSILKIKRKKKSKKQLRKFQMKVPKDKSG